jgi:hypothetical protein
MNQKFPERSRDRRAQICRPAKAGSRLLRQMEALARVAEAEHKRHIVMM